MSTKPTNHSLAVFGAIAGAVIIFVFCLYGGRLHSNLEIRKEQQKMDNILEQINQLYIANDDLQTQWEELEKQQQQIHGSAEENRQKIDELWEEYDNSKLFLMAGQDQNK